MTKQVINLGTAPSGAGGDDRRSAWVKAIANFDEIYQFMDGLQSQANSNGYFVKYPDGTMEVTGFVILPAQVISIGVSATRVFAAPFVGIPTVVYSCDGASGTGAQNDVGLVNMNGTFIAVTPTQFTLNSYSYRSATANPTRWSFRATGRWK
ncbi:hypothetical protein [Pseudomonas faucium]|uniref:hypothetical protein n=1 Tax=Pseudomonas faucium TaxID=2740518 RepID=UPI001596D630|nr:hypothetical protein [Pseudomonas faucium]